MTSLAEDDWFLFKGFLFKSLIGHFSTRLYLFSTKIITKKPKLAQEKFLGKLHAR